ncbi:hypothetical protein AGMMS50276_00310 [Synergistales bacterium]|nr:hypothetical protein AGMMS50276_00310 [Synergistales bacterium]
MRKDNENPVVKRIAVKASCEFATPALIGSGFGENTDSDILRHNDGNAFLPGSTIAGVLCSLTKNKDKSNDLFGALDSISPLWVYDAELYEPKDRNPAKVIELDGVALDRLNKVAIDAKKYDYEAVDCGTIFTLYFLLTIRARDKDKGYEDLLKQLLGVIKANEVAFGAKTKRGFGRVSCKKLLTREFDLASGNTDALDDWIKFDMRAADEEAAKLWQEAQTIEYSGNYETLTVKLKLDGSIMIRDMRNIFDDEKAPDYQHISVGGKPTILGTSWAGAFRSGLYRLLSQKYPEKAERYLDNVFGYVKEASGADEAKSEPSKVIFGASFLEESDKKTDGYRNITRVKIDRFTGGAADGALFSEKPWYGGKTELKVRYPKDCEDIRELLLLGFDALDKGLIQIGGETSVGRGFVKDVTVSDKSGNITINAPKPKLKDALENSKNSEKAGETA